MTEQKNDDCYAFPQMEHFERTVSGITQDVLVPVGGMSLRDWFAGMVLNGWMSNQSSVPEPEKGDIETVTQCGALFAYKMANAMLNERDK